MDNDSTTKECHVCHEVKSQSEFYYSQKYATKDNRLNHCKSCIRARAYNQQKGKTVPGYATEQLIIDQCARFGIPAAPGKASPLSRQDVVAWGCVSIEVKSAIQKYNAFLFNFTSQHRSRKVLSSDLVALICLYSDTKTYHIFPSNHPTFYMNGNIVKAGAQYLLNPAHRKTVNSIVLDHSLMNLHQDAWELIEYYRQKKGCELLGQPFAPKINPKLIAFHKQLSLL